jgi:hypothetical protein
VKWVQLSTITLALSLLVAIHPWLMKIPYGKKKKVVSSSNGPNMCGSILSFPVTKSTAMIN